MKYKIKNIIMDIIYILLASFILTCALLIFTIPNNLVPGGVSGLSTVAAHFVPYKVGTINLMLSLVIAALAWWQLGLKTIFKSTTAAVVISLLLNLLSGVLPVYKENVLIAAIAGGALLGAGTGILFLGNMSSGGTDTIGLIVKKFFPHVSIGKLMISIDSTIVIFGTLAFRNINVAVYSVITIFCAGKVIDLIQQGIDYAKLIYIVTDKSEEVAKALREKADVGITILPAYGGYTGEQKNILMVAVKKVKLSITLKTMKEIDKSAFVIIQDTTEVHGLGFKL